MNLRPKVLPFDPGTHAGLSSELLRSHQHQHDGAVERLQALRARLAGLETGVVPGVPLTGLKQEELVATYSMLLHALCLASWGDVGTAKAPGMTLALTTNFGSVERWQAEFVAMAEALVGGSGWVLLVFQPGNGTLVNQRLAMHSPAAAGGVPLLALNLHEHAHAMVFGAAAGDCVAAFIGHIHWIAVYERYQAAVHSAGEALGVSQDGVAGAAVILDVRRAGVYEQSTTTLPGARWADPATVDEWARDLPTNQAVLVYCVYGHEVSRVTALRLQAAGIQAHFLRGGVDAWAKAGRPLVTKGTAP